MNNHLNIKCPYCDNKADLVTGDFIYNNRFDLKNRYFYLCKPCDAYVGCHKASKKWGDGTIPYGRIANKELRYLKRKAHESFDPLWTKTIMPRNTAYKWLADKLNIKYDECHIGMFDCNKCIKTIDICNKKLKEFRI